MYVNHKLVNGASLDRKIKDNIKFLNIHKCPFLVQNSSSRNIYNTTTAAILYGNISSPHSKLNDHINNNLMWNIKSVVFRKKYQIQSFINKNDYVNGSTIPLISSSSKDIFITSLRNTNEKKHFKLYASESNNNDSVQPRHRQKNPNASHNNKSSKQNKIDSVAHKPMSTSSINKLDTNQQAIVKENENVVSAQQQMPIPSIENTTSESFKIKEYVIMVILFLMVGVILTAITFFFVSDIELKIALTKALRKMYKSVAARQTYAILFAMVFVRFGLMPAAKGIRTILEVKTPWEKSIENYLLKEMYQPLEFLLGVAALSTVTENVLPALISVPRSTIAHVMRTIVTITFIISATRVIFNIKSRITREARWKLELEGKLTEERNIGAINKLLTFCVLTISFILCIQTIGVDINSLIQIGGVGGIFIGFAGREIFENLMSGLFLMGSRPFYVGEEIRFTYNNESVNGIVTDIGWYRCLVKTFEREVYAIPNSIFSKTVVLNITKKNREWRFFEFLQLRLCDMDVIENVIGDMRRILKQDDRINQNLHRRVFLDKITREYIEILISFYVEAANRDAFMAAKQRLYLAFVDCVTRNGAEFAEKKLNIFFQDDRNKQQLSRDDFELMDMSSTRSSSSGDLSSAADTFVTSKTNVIRQSSEMAAKYYEGGTDDRD